MTLGRVVNCDHRTFVSLASVYLIQGFYSIPASARPWEGYLVVGCYERQKYEPVYSKQFQQN